MNYLKKGGINKDSGLYLFSPHADLHLKAAELAIEHTEYYFNQIRKKIGDKEFSNFLDLEVCDENSRIKSSSNRNTFLSATFLVNLFFTSIVFSFLY